MKTSVKIIAGVVTGVLLAFLLPTNNIVLKLFSEMSLTLLSMGRYIILPLMFFSLIISVSQFQKNKKLFKNILKLTGVTAAFSFSLVVLGVIASLIFSPGQIPVVIDGIQNINVPTFKEIITASFPDNIFTIFQGDFNSNNNQFVPFFVLALILGVFFTKGTKEEIEPTFNLVDSLSRIFFKINVFFYKISFFWVAILTTTYISIVKNIIDISLFLPLLYMLGALTLIIIFIIYPIILCVICGKKNPIKYFIAEFPSLITAIITGDQFFTCSAIMLSQKKEFKIKRKFSGFNVPFLSLFSKSGTALVSVITFIVILKSYSSLEITLTQILWVAIMSFVVSFCLPTKAVGGIIASLYLLCSLYGYGGLEDSFIILTPAFPLLAAISTVLNTSTIILVSAIMDPERKN